MEPEEVRSKDRREEATEAGLDWVRVKVVLEKAALKERRVARSEIESGTQVTPRSL